MLEVQLIIDGVKLTVVIFGGLVSDFPTCVKPIEPAGILIDWKREPTSYHLPWFAMSRHYQRQNASHART